AKLPTTTGWDSHNYIDMAIDDSGYLHISGNMHNTKLIYFRSEKPWSISSFTSPGMIGTEENSVTYPLFIKGLNGQLIFQYRDGGSGSGNTIWNGYDIKAKKWYRITKKALFDGEGKVNAYHTSPIMGPDSFFHIIWMWRDSPIANTNHDLSHIKSKDLLNWQTMNNKAITLPITMGTQGVVVDPVKSGNGLINMDFWISWDRKNRAVVTYHKYDDNDISQIFNTRWEENRWIIYQTSNWKNFKWNLDREGSLSHDIAATPLSVDENGELVQDYVYLSSQLRRWILDETTLKPRVDTLYIPPEPMKVLYNVESTFPGMQVNFIKEGEYYIRWETMPINQDKPRSEGTYPSSSELRLYRFTTNRITKASSNFKIGNKDFKVKIERDKIVVYFLQKSLKDLKVAIFSVKGKLMAQGYIDKTGICIIKTTLFSKGSYILFIKGEYNIGKNILFIN
ncbi:MAG: BNR repeat-containing protein, partial [Chitinispirillaceae bacterium]|nr:BNR repeat-containing protein [Chitinispirillaceae bacterium]